ncbi:MAG TPA: pseudaminic acid synthase, partial [Gemmatimonadetes bacterium]|nr:pseudaminic acid synthase [Gemmatimonadota bacterium]
MAGGSLAGRHLRSSEGSAFRRSLYVTQDIRKGDRFDSANLRAIRPGHGLHPRFEDLFLGGVAASSIPRGTPLDWSMLSGQ